MMSTVYEFYLITFDPIAYCCVWYSAIQLLVTQDVCFDTQLQGYSRIVVLVCLTIRVFPLAPAVQQCYPAFRLWRNPKHFFHIPRYPKLWKRLQRQKRGNWQHTEINTVLPITGQNMPLCMGEFWNFSQHFITFRQLFHSVDVQRNAGWETLLCGIEVQGDCQ